MKKCLIFLLTAALLLALSSCGAGQAKDPGNFYYRRTEPEYLGSEGIIASEIRDLSDLRGDLGKLLEAYLLGPQSDHLQSPFPRDTRLIEWKHENDVLKITLSEEFAQLSGIELTVACGCIARTFLELTDVSAVQLQVQDALLNSNPFITMARDTLSLSDDGIEKLRTDLTLYYTDEDRRYLIGHTISVNLAALDNVETYLVEQLKTAPSGMGLVSPLPSGTKLLSCSISNGVCVLNFSGEFESNGYSESYAQRTTLLSLVNTLTQLDHIDRVELQLEGTLMVRYRQFNISKALIFDESAIGPVRTGVNEFDSTLYLCNGSSAYLSAVPARIQYTTGISQAELVVNNLLTYQNPNGFYTPIPSATKLNSVKTVDGLCTVDLSQEFLSSEDLILSARAVCASVCDLEGIDSVQILIDGTVPADVPTYLFEPMTPDPNWFA